MKATPLLIIACAFAALVYPVPLAQAQVVLTGHSYSQDFNDLGSGLPAGWTVRTGATASSQGTAGLFTPTAVSWTLGDGGFRNVASGVLGMGASTETQNDSTNRALGIRQTGAFGDPGASFQFNFNSSGLTVTALSIELQMLSVQGRSTSWSLEWSSNAGTTWTALDTWSSPETFGVTSKIFTGLDVAGLGNISDGLFRVAALSETTGSGSRDTIAIDNFTLSYVPEPSTYVFLLALAAFGSVHLRRILGRREPAVHHSS